MWVLIKGQIAPKIWHIFGPHGWDFFFVPYYIIYTHIYIDGKKLVPCPCSVNQLRFVCDSISRGEKLEHAKINRHEIISISFYCSYSLELLWLGPNKVDSNKYLHNIFAIWSWTVGHNSILHVYYEGLCGSVYTRRVGVLWKYMLYS